MTIDTEGAGAATKNIIVSLENADPLMMKVVSVETERSARRAVTEFTIRGQFRYHQILKERVIATTGKDAEDGVWDIRILLLIGDRRIPGTGLYDAKVMLELSDLVVDSDAVIPWLLGSTVMLRLRDDLRQTALLTAPCEEMQNRAIDRLEFARHLLTMPANPPRALLVPEFKVISALSVYSGREEPLDLRTKDRGEGAKA